jgi:hypothetical protein
MPLAFEPQADGSLKDMKLFDLGESKRDLTQSKIKKDDKVIENPLGGLHPTFQGKAPLRQLHEDTQEHAKKMIKTKPQAAEPPTVDLGLTSEEAAEAKKPHDLLKFLQNKSKQSKIKAIIQKYSSKGMWLDDKGRSYSSEEDMKKVLYKEMIKDSEKEIVDRAVKAGMDQLKSVPVELPKKKQKPQEDEKLPLAAKTKLKTLISSTSNPRLKVRLAKLLVKVAEENREFPEESDDTNYTSTDMSNPIKKFEVPHLSCTFCGIRSEYSIPSLNASVCEFCLEDKIMPSDEISDEEKEYLQQVQKSIHEDWK